MSRSVRNRNDKKGVHLKWCGFSNKKDKTIANRKFRKHETEEARKTLLEGEDNFKTNDIKDVSNNWNFSSDGRAHYMELDASNKWRGPIDKDEQYKYRNK